jgi:hypothetical protein
VLCQQAGFQPLVVQESGQPITVLNYVAAGLGVTILPAQFSRLVTAGVCFIPLARPTPGTAIAPHACGTTATRPWRILSESPARSAKGGWRRRCAETRSPIDRVLDFDRCRPDNDCAPSRRDHEMTAIFHRRSACRESRGANAETCPAHARASGLEPGGPALRTVVPRAHRTLSLLRHRRRAIARGPEAPTRE